LLRKGRFHQVLHVPPPSHGTRIKLLDYFGKKCSLSLDVIEATLVPLLKDGMSGAEVENICREEAIRKMRLILEDIGNNNN
jgi:ATP-dependent 26S proteasome regulatory subunit